MIKGTFTARETNEDKAPNSGFPLPARSLVNTLERLKVTIPGNNIISGFTEGRKAEPNIN
ncbi:hypothetical protein BPIT_28850 [Candidatus Brocadia pituitae]|nr:hypothetical protein BPIT_28850 [Candidatus Brocadia pituitae]